MQPSRIEKSIEVDVPVTTCYNQWTQFEEFPRFMSNVEAVRQLGDNKLHWVAKIAGKRKEWDADIIEQEPDRVISWKSTTGPKNEGMVRFEPLGADRCKVYLMMNYETETPLEKVGDLVGVVSAQIEGDLRRFKKFIEERQVETGKWRGAIHKRDVVKGDEQTVAGGGYGGLTGTTGYNAGGYGGTGTTDYKKTSDHDKVARGEKL